MMRTLSVLALLVGCGGAPAPAAPTAASDPAPAATKAGSVREVDVEWLATHRDEVPVLLDVRTDREYASGHAPGAINIPMDQVERRLSELEPYKDQEVYLICQSGGRSSRVAEQLADLGFTAVNVAGGTSAWIAAGNPVE